MARKPASATDSSKVLSRRALVLIDRDLTAKTPRAVWQHEIPILEAVFGEGKVSPIDSATMDEGFSAKPSPDMLPYNKSQDAAIPPSQASGIGWVFTGDPEAEYNRLSEVYGMMPEERRTFVEFVYGRFQEGRFSAVVGAADVEDLPESQLRDMIKGYGFLPALSHESTDAEKQAARAKQVQLQKAERAELLQIAESVGVTLD